MTNIEKIADCIELTVVCSYCLKADGYFDAFDVHDLAEFLDEEGWEVNRAGKIKCPECVKKMKRS